MVEISRRSFFRLAVGAAAVVAVPIPLGDVARIPVLYGDGVHDDAEGLNALIRGEEVSFADPAMASRVGWRKGFLDLGGVTFHVKTPVLVDSGRQPPIHLRNMDLSSGHDFEGAALIVAMPFEQYIGGA